MVLLSLCAVVLLLFAGFVSLCGNLCVCVFVLCLLQSLGVCEFLFDFIFFIIISSWSLCFFSFASLWSFSPVCGCFLCLPCCLVTLWDHLATPCCCLSFLFCSYKSLPFLFCDIFFVFFQVFLVQYVCVPFLILCVCVWLFCISLRSFCIPLCSVFISSGFAFHLFVVVFIFQKSFCTCFYLSVVIIHLYFGHCAALYGYLFIYLFIFCILVVFFIWLFDFFWWSAENNTSDTEVLVLGLLLVGSSSNSSMILKSYHPPSLPPLWPHLCWWTQWLCDSCSSLTDQE